MKEDMKCVYCGKNATTREHVPSKCFLDKPYPDNLLTLPACKECNNGFSEDEQYFFYLSDYISSIENYEGEFTREKVKLSFDHSDKLEDRMINSLKIENDSVYFQFETDRILRVIEKNAYGLLHTKFRGKIKITKSNFIPLTILSHEQKLEYELLEWIVIQDKRFKYIIQNAIIFFVVNDIFLCVASYCV